MVARGERGVIGEADRKRWAGAKGENGERV